MILLWADLHIHTNASDGSDTPDEVVKKAVKQGLRAIAISDHDTLNGVIPAQEAAREYSLEVISGVEVNTYYQGSEIHILGYHIKPDNDEFTSKLRELQGDRLDRIARMVKKLRTLDIHIDLDRVLELARGATIGRPHVARAMVESGYVASPQAAFNTYLGAGKPAFIPRERLTPQEAVGLITRVGGVPVLAHPGLISNDKILPMLLGAGIKGLEVWHVKHTPLMVNYYLNITKKNKLIATGGSDYHGCIHETCNRLGCCVAPYEAVLRLREVAEITR